QYDIFPDSSRSGILTYTRTYFFDSSGKFLDATVHGGKISQVTDGLSNTVMIGERPPTPDLWIGRWVYSDFDVRNGAAETSFLYLATTSGGPNGTGTPCPSPAYFGPGNNTN